MEIGGKKMQTNPLIQQLDTRTVENIISYLTEDIREGLPDENKSTIKSIEEANDAIIELLRTNGSMIDENPSDLVSKPEGSRLLLQLLWNDDELRPKVDELLLNPPVDSQRSAEMALSAAVIIGGLITWLQTKIEIQITRQDGKTEFKFHFLKSKTSDNLVKDVVKPISNILLGISSNDKTSQ